MKAITSAIQAILDADSNHPVTVATITLTDATVVRVATRAVTIGGNSFSGYLQGEPQLVVTLDSGLDHTKLTINNADWANSYYHNEDLFEGASVSVQQYFATDSGYTTFEGPVLTFTGTVSSPESHGPGLLSLTVLMDTRVSGEGVIGRVITGGCMNTFRDGNCGYTHSATVATGGTYVSPAAIPLSEALVDGQSGVGARALLGSPNDKDRIKITRGGTAIYGVTSKLHVLASGLVSGVSEVNLTEDVTVQAGDKIEYIECPKNYMGACMRRWQVGSTTRQQDRWMGFEYHKSSFYRPDLAVVGRYNDILGQIVPIAYGTRWVDPVLFGGHQLIGASAGTAWNSTVEGPFVVALISEGPVDTGIVDAETDVDLDGRLASDIPYYDEDVTSHIDVKTGDTGQTVSDFAPLCSRTSGPNTAAEKIPALPAFDHVAYTIFDLPNNYDFAESFTPEPAYDKRGVPLWGGTRRFPKKPGLRLKIKGRKVYTWSMVGGVATKSASRAYSTNPVWQLLDLLTSPQRVDDGDGWSLELAESGLDLEGFIEWADYFDETVTARDADGNTASVTRSVSSLYHRTSDRSEAIGALFRAVRGMLVFRGGKVGLACDAPTGGKGTLTGVATTTLTDSSRDGETNPTFPTNVLEGLNCQMLTGASAGEVRSVAANVSNSWTISSAFTDAQVGDQYAIYAVELTTDNCGEITREKVTPPDQLPNQISAQFESEDHKGALATIPIVNSESLTHASRFGLINEDVPLAATTTWHQAIRAGWYELMKAHLTNRQWHIRDANIEALPIEVGDICLLTHDVDGVENETVRIVEVSQDQAGRYSLTGRLYREDVHLNWPTEDYEDAPISSGLVSPNAIPAHVESPATSMVQESSKEAPLLVCSYTLPQWPYAGGSVVLEARYQTNVSPEEWSDWEQYATSDTAKASFRAPRRGLFQVRPVFVSHLRVRADDPISQGTPSGGTTTTLEDSTKSWVANEFVGATLKVTDGADEYESTITANTTDTITTAAIGTTPTALMSYQVYYPAPTAQEDITSGTAYGVPVLDVDDGVLKFSPGFVLGSSCRVFDSDTVPDKATVIASGDLITSEDQTDLYTYVSANEVRYVGIVYYLDDAGTDGESALFSRSRANVTGADGVPIIITRPYFPDDAQKEGVEFIVTDEGTQVNFGYVVLDSTAPAPTWPTGFTLTGLAADPQRVSVEVTRPQPGAATKYIYFQAIDEDDNLAYAGGAEIIVVDENGVPKGSFNHDVNRSTGAITLIPQAVDSDAMSWRVRVNMTDVGAESYLGILFDDTAAGEFSGLGFGSSVPLVAPYGTLVKGKVLCVRAQFYRTIATDDASQQTAPQSPEMTFPIYMGEETECKVRNVSITTELAPPGIFWGANLRFKIVMEVGAGCSSVYIEDGLGYHYWQNVTAGGNYSGYITALYSFSGAPSGFTLTPNTGSGGAGVDGVSNTFAVAGLEGGSGVQVKSGGTTYADPALTLPSGGGLQLDVSSDALELSVSPSSFIVSSSTDPGATNYPAGSLWFKP